MLNATRSKVSDVWISIDRAQPTDSRVERRKKNERTDERKIHSREMIDETVEIIIENTEPRAAGSMNVKREKTHTLMERSHGGGFFPHVSVRSHRGKKTSIPSFGGRERTIHVEGGG